MFVTCLCKLFIISCFECSHASGWIWIVLFMHLSFEVCDWVMNWVDWVYVLGYEWSNWFASICVHYMFLFKGLNFFGKCPYNRGGPTEILAKSFFHLSLSFWYDNMEKWSICKISAYLQNISVSSGEAYNSDQFENYNIKLKGSLFKKGSYIQISLVA